MLSNALILALRELRRNKMRSFLTMLGIIIGVAAVISLVTIGEGATRQVTEQISSLGSNLMMVAPGKRMGPGQGGGAAPFKLADAEAIAREIPGLRAVAPTCGAAATAIYANENLVPRSPAPRTSSLKSPACASRKDAASRNPKCGPVRPYASSAKQYAPTSSGGRVPSAARSG